MKAKLVSFLVLIVAGVASYLGQGVGTSGGKIRHTEIRSDVASAINPPTSTNKED